MGFEAGYLLAALGEGGVPTVPLFGSRLWRENLKTAEQFKKLGASIQKKIFRHYVAKTVFFGERPVLSSAGLVRPGGGGEVGTC